jgi:hypothetical protein
MFSKKIKYQISRKSLQWEWSCLGGRTDGHIYMAELTVAFHNSANEPKNLCVEITRISGKEDTINTHTILDGKPDLTWKI